MVLPAASSLALTGIATSPGLRILCQQRGGWVDRSQEERTVMWQRGNDILKVHWGCHLHTCFCRTGYMKLWIATIRSDIAPARVSRLNQQDAVDVPARPGTDSAPCLADGNSMGWGARCKRFFYKWTRTGSSLTSKQVWWPAPFFLSPEYEGIFMTCNPRL